MSYDPFVNINHFTHIKIGNKCYNPKQLSEKLEKIDELEQQIVELQELVKKLQSLIIQQLQ